MIEEQALGWVIRTRDPEFVDWEGFTAWLEADDVHAWTYDRLAVVDEELPSILPAEPMLPTPANDPGAPGWRRWRLAGAGAIAAGLVALLSVNMLRDASDPYAVTTAAGEQRTLALADGTRIDMNGSTVLRLDRANMRIATLERGEAAFTVTHDPKDPFRVNVGNAVFEDAGTVFNIVHEGDITRIGVSEGEVVYNPSAEAIALPAGRALRSDGDALTLSAVEHGAVTGWRDGRLAYANAAVNEVAGDIGRTLGIHVMTSPGVAAMRFTGTLAIDRDAGRFFDRAGPVMGVRAERKGKDWLLKEADDATD